jgi:hypothetical protein
MSTPRHSLPDVRDERGGVLVMVAVFLPVLILFITFVVDVGNWFEHKRHLQVQADAAALAGAGKFAFPGCDDTAIQNETRKYGGDPTVSPRFNNQVKDSRNVHLLINSTDYWSTGVEWSYGGHPCTAKWVDVKMTQANLPWFFGVDVVPKITAHAKVEIRQIDTISGALPVGVPDVNPQFAFAKFVDETQANAPAISGCTSGGTAVPNCEFPLVKQPGSSGGLVFWNNTAAPVSVPIASAKIGVRIRLVGGSDSTLQCGAVLVECYDQQSANGVVFVRGYAASSGTPPNPPTAGDVSLFDGNCPDPYFSASTTSCTLGVHAKVAFPAGVSPASSCPSSGNSFTGGCVYAVASNGQTVPLTFNNATGYWDSTGSNFFSIAPGSGPINVDLRWRVKQNGITINAANCGQGNGCADTITGVQRTFAAVTDRSGPL